VDTGFTEIDLANFTGRPPEYYNSNFVMEALAQAGDLFELATERTELPTEGLAGRIAARGVLAMAEAIFEGNNYRDLRASPFKTETIGSYTYTLAEGSVLAGIPTGISWFDLAVDRLALSTRTSISNRSVHAFQRPGDTGSIGGHESLIGPADTEEFRQGPASYGGNGGVLG
jgi:hypothetical protein